MKSFLRLVALTLAALFTFPAIANDSTAETAAGGLVLQNSTDIDMLSEDLYVSAEQVRVRYIFRNQSDADIRTIVAFPMPDRNLSEEGDYDIAFPADFRTIVADQPVDTEIELRAVLGEDDHTDTLQSLGVPITPGADDRAMWTALGALSDENLRRLAELGLVDVYRAEGQAVEVRPLWTVRETFYWEQVFPAGHDLPVEHSYRPGVGGTAGTMLANAELMANDEYGQQMIADYCIDQNFLAGARRLIARDEGWVTEQTIGYILTTGANWRSPIGEFRLVVDKGNPRNLVSFCAEGVRRISPTQFEVRHSIWRPEQDLRVIILVAGPDEAE